MQGGGADGAGSSADGVSEAAPLLGAQQQQQQQQLMVQQDTYLTSRAEALHQVESTIVELGSIFQQLAHMVAEQGEAAVRIDENVEDTLGHVDAGQAQLLKYLNTISSNRCGGVDGGGCSLCSAPSSHSLSSALRPPTPTCAGGCL